MKGKFKRSIAFLMVLLMVFNMGIAAYAEGNPSNLNENEVIQVRVSSPGGPNGNDDTALEGDQITVTEAVYEGDTGGDTNPIDQIPPKVEKAYEVLYLLQETDEPIEGLDPITGSAGVGATIEIPHPEIEGYQVVADQPTILVISEDEEMNKVVVYYEVVEEVEEVAGNVNLTYEVGGITITVTGDAGVIPEDTVLSVKQLSDSEALDYVEAIRENEGVELEEYLAFDITLQDKEGNEIQPNGEVTVSFSGIEFSNETDEVMVYHVEPDGSKENEPMTLGKSTAFGMMSVDDDSTDGIRVTNMPANVNNGVVRFSTNHFSIYLVGTTATATYEFYNGSVLVDTQIILNGDVLVEPEAPEAQAGKKFIGWFVEGETEPIDFDEPKTVTETAVIKVRAVYDDIYYVYFIYNGNVIATKEVEPNGKVDASDVLLVVNEEGKAFSHWSTEEDGDEPFNFDAEITEDITLYAVLADRWKVTFDTQGGTPLLPKYIIHGSLIGTVETPTKLGYDFKHWSLEPNGQKYNLNMPVTSNIKLYAVWDAKKNTPYRVVYWLENANDDGYTYEEIVVKSGTTGTSAEFDNKIYTGFHLNSTKTNAENVIIKGDGSTIKNVYYDRNRYTLEFRSNNNSILRTFNNIKQGADTSPWWNEVANDYRQYTWYTERYGNISYTLPPAMPNKNLTVYGRVAGNHKYTILYLENVSGYPPVNEKYEFYDYYGWDYEVVLTSEDYVNFPGFTVKSKPGDGSEKVKHNPETGKYDVFKIYYTRNKYDITFHKNDSTGQTTIKNIPYEADISDKALSGYIVDVTTRSTDGYVFKGWYTNEATVGEPFEFEDAKMPAGNLILYAKWVPPVHKIIAHETQDEDGPTNTYTANHGDTVDESILEKQIPTGLTEDDFLGWYWFVSGVFVPFDFNMPIYNDVELFPVWNVKNYSVTYDLNGGIGNVIDTNSYYLGAAAVVLPPTDVTPPANKVFVGWKESESGKIYYPNDKLLITGNMTLVAQWGDKAPRTQLTYYGNGGVSASGQESIVISLKNNETHIVIPGDTFIRKGYIFVEWNTKKDGTGDSFSPGDSIIVDNKEPLPNELYCQYEVDESQQFGYTINYYIDGTTEPVPGIDPNPVTGTGHVGEVIDIAHPAVTTGYKVADEQPTSLTVTANAAANVADVYYVVDESQQFGYTINYYIDGTTEPVPGIDPNPVTGT
ncbi:InlB B-repeat-containing protein, partial [Lutispora sp.]|uniref:InlB B-repeat-containing protein n=1 Tax=Lutispora sp. TaxID=2828727 RepID=UPI00356B5ECB